jgi:RsiW-degrading membrane proteinase PrsW (M82 family)
MLFATYALIAGFIAWIWIDYYRLIEVYGREDLKYVLFTFFLGAASFFIVWSIRKYNMLNQIPFWVDGTALNDFAYCTVKIALPEELVKFIPFVIVFLLFRGQFKQPLDYIAFAATGALGFAAAENTFSFLQYNGEIVFTRAILTSVGHMFYTILIAYGIMLSIYRDTKYWFSNLLGFTLLAILGHAYYEFWFVYSEGTYGYLMSIPFFIFSVSCFATILNNALNNDSTFTYKKTIDSDFVFTRILTYYGILFAVQFIINAYQKDFVAAMTLMIGALVCTVPIIFSAAGRLSRFTLIQNRWSPLRIELPIAITTGPDADFIIRGGLPAENILNKYYEEYITIHPISDHAAISHSKMAFLEKKLFLENDEIFFMIKVFKDDTRQQFEKSVLKPKTGGDRFFADKYPITSLLRYKGTATIDDAKTAEDFGFVEWVYVKPIETTT